MVKAIDIAKAKLGGSKKKLEAEGRESADYFVEPSQPAKKPGKTEFAPTKHLNEAERAYCQNTAQRTHVPLETVYKNYWNHLDDPKKPVSLREERLKAGRSMTYKQLGY
jgi:hypothetical protein